MISATARHARSKHSFRTGSWLLTYHPPSSYHLNQVEITFTSRINPRLTPAKQWGCGGSRPHFRYPFLLHSPSVQHLALTRLVNLTNLNLQYSQVMALFYGGLVLSSNPSTPTSTPTRGQNNLPIMQNAQRPANDVLPKHTPNWFARSGDHMALVQHCEFPSIDANDPEIMKLVEGLKGKDPGHVPGRTRIVTLDVPAKIEAKKRHNGFVSLSELEFETQMVAMVIEWESSKLTVKKRLRMKPLSYNPSTDKATGETIKKVEARDAILDEHFSVPVLDITKEGTLNILREIWTKKPPVDSKYSVIPSKYWDRLLDEAGKVPLDRVEVKVDEEVLHLDTVSQSFMLNTFHTMHGKERG